LARVGIVLLLVFEVVTEGWSLAEDMTVEAIC